MNKWIKDLMYTYSTYKDLPHALSAPRVPILYTWLNGKYYPCWRMHDDNYGSASITRAEADRDLFNDLRAFGASYLFAACAWLSVRLVGWWHYQE